jgi:hypothetical protein
MGMHKLICQENPFNSIDEKKTFSSVHCFLRKFIVLRDQRRNMTSITISGKNHLVLF